VDNIVSRWETVAKQFVMTAMAEFHARFAFIAPLGTMPDDPRGAHPKHPALFDC